MWVACLASGQAYAKLAEQNGATLHTGERVLSWRALGPSSGVEITTDRRVIEAGAAIFAAGPWMRQLVPQLSGLCVPERQVVAWFHSSVPHHFQPATFPVYIIMVSMSSSKASHPFCDSNLTWRAVNKHAACI